MTERLIPYLVAPLLEYQGVSERLWGVSVNDFDFCFFVACDYPLQRGGCHLLVTAKF